MVNIRDTKINYIEKFTHTKQCKNTIDKYVNLNRVRGVYIFIIHKRKKKDQEFKSPLLLVLLLNLK